MGRPSLAEQRRAEILGALERCVLRDGVARTTVQAVAAEAGCKRTLINHYFGDMESLVDALLVKLTDEFAASFGAAAAARPGRSTLLDFMFRRPPTRANRLIGALRAPGFQASPEPFKKLAENAAETLAVYLCGEFPDASAGRCRSVAFALTCLANSRFQMMSVGVSKKYTQTLRVSAQQLLDSLAEV